MGSDWVKKHKAARLKAQELFEQFNFVSHKLYSEENEITYLDVSEIVEKCLKSSEAAQKNMLGFYTYKPINSWL